MPDNSQQLLHDILTQQRQRLAPMLSEQAYFELFCAEQMLKDFDLSYEELRSGIVDGEHDGGIDGIFAFVNGELIREDFNPLPYKKDVRIELHILQAKTGAGFSEAMVNRVISASRHLMQLDAEYSSLGQYNESVLSVMDDFRGAYRKLASQFPRLNIVYYFAAKRADSSIHPNLTRKANELRETVKDLFPEANTEVQFLDARRLVELARSRPRTTYPLRVKKNLSDIDGYVVLSSLYDYAAFLKSEDGKIRSELFETNVRAFQGTTEVNEDIASTLHNERDVEFWWMNNGVTIIASRATLNGDIVTIENPQIVNGLQTSTQIAQHFTGGDEDGRAVMIKIVSSEDEETRDKIIKATNRQNPIQPATLRATDKVQRDIEEALKANGFFYDRRKNFYKNEGRPADRIISIPLMAQTVMSMVLQRPDTARARPSSLIKKDSVYAQVFSEGIPLGLYTSAAALVRRVDSVLRSRPELKARDRTNLRFYVLFWLAAWCTGTPQPKAGHIAGLDVDQIEDQDFEEAVTAIWDLYKRRGKTDQVAKGPELRKAAIRGVSARLRKARQETTNREGLRIGQGISRRQMTGR